MDLLTRPAELACTACGEPITDAGYLPATEREAGYEPQADEAVCDDCGFNDVGMTGCAPELDDVVEPDTADVLLYVRWTDDGPAVVSAKD